MLCNISCPGAIGNALTLYIEGPGFDSCCEKLFFPFFFSRVLFLFLKTYLHFLTDLKYTGRVIASSTSAFIFMIINPWVAIGTLWFLFWMALYALILSKTSRPGLIQGYHNLSFSRYSWKLAPGNIIQCNLDITNLYVTNSFCLSQ